MKAHKSPYGRIETLSYIYPLEETNKIPLSVTILQKKGLIINILY